MTRFLTPSLTALALLFCACGPSKHYPSVIVLGVDGMDPSFVERHWDVLPNLAALRDQGTFCRLGTTWPPQSPVAWSTFITGLDPADHEIFDFVHRDPVTLLPFSSMSRTEPARWTLRLGPYVFPLIASRVVSLRQGTPFWRPIADDGVPVSVIRMPTNYPPVQVGHALAGMGTPDLLGTQGTFTLLTDDPTETSRSVPGGRFAKVNFNQGHAVFSLEGPANVLRKDGKPATVDLTIDVDAENPVALIKVGKEVLILKEGEWSGWIPVEFVLIPHISSVQGMVRLFAKQLHPGLELYVSPINMDPSKPALPISAPVGWSETVSKETGRYFTLGIPEDTSALRQGALTLAQFQAQTQLVFEEEHRLFLYSLRHYQGGLLFFYFSSVDQDSHILWGRHEDELLQIYRKVDDCIGEVRRDFKGAELIVMSDHGFAAFDRSVHLNSWLNHRGFLAVNGQPGSDDDITAIDWSGTKAYALGLNGLYVNLKGRESKGRVARGPQRQALIANLKLQLLAWRDQSNGRQVIEAIHETRETAHNYQVAPDLIVGYTPGYRASWQTGIGGTPSYEIEDNTDLWIGDHCIDPSAVPGVLFTSRKIAPQATRAQPSLKDVTATVLALFGYAGKEMASGKNLY